MSPVHGRTARMTGLRTWTVLLFTLLASCQTQQPARLPPEAKIAIVVSRDSNRAKQLQQAVKNSLGTQGEFVRVGTSQRGILRASGELSSKSYSAIVVLDRAAAALVRRVPRKAFYFGQSFDYRLASKAGSRFRGVNIVPDADPVLGALHQLDKSPKTIGIIAGAHLEPMIDQIRTKARKYKFRINFRKVASDREFLYQARQMSKATDVYWLLPDSRVLSGRAIKRFMQWAVRQGKPVISFTPTLLKLGAIMSVEPNDDAVASEIRRLLIIDLAGKGKNFPEMKYVSTVDFSISKLAADRVGYQVPANLKQYLSN